MRSHEPELKLEPSVFCSTDLNITLENEHILGMEKNDPESLRLWQMRFVPMPHCERDIQDRAIRCLCQDRELKVANAAFA